MKHDFGKYIYYNPIKSNIEPEEFSKEKRDSLIAQGKYKEAVNYSRQYYPKDPEKAAKYNLDIANLERTAKIYEAKLQRLGKDKDLVQFVDLLYQGNLSNYVGDNDYINDYNNKIKSLGSDDNVSITFKPKKQYGLFGWDWLAADNEEYNIDVFYKNSGLSKAQLESAGVKVINEEDGSTTIKVNKGHELFNKIIMRVPMDRPSTITTDGLFGGHDKDENAPIINTNRIDDPSYNRLYYLQQEVKDAQEKRDNIFKKYEPESVQKSGFTMRLVTPELLQVEQAAINGELKEFQYKTLKNLIFDEVNRELITTPFGNYDKVYTNRFNKRGDETFREAPVDELVNLQDKLRTNIDDLEYSVYNNGVEEGLMITYKGKEKDKSKLPTDIDADLENHMADVSFSVFIPGMAADFINSAVGLDPNYRASKELLDMANYGITHELEDGTVLHADNNGRIFAKGVEIDRNEALRLINKDFVVEDARRQFLYDSVNKDNNIIDEEAYDLKAKKQAIAYATETYPEVNLFYDYDNTSEYDNIEDYVFSKQIAGEIQEPVAEKMPYDVYNVYTELFDVYRRIMTGLTNHKNIYN